MNRLLALHADGCVHRQPPDKRRVDAQHVDDKPRGDLAAVDEACVPVLCDALVMVCTSRRRSCVRFCRRVSILMRKSWDSPEKLGFTE
jgi:hypothetical protein